MDNGWPRLVVLLLGDPHLLEGGEGSKDGATNPYRVFPLWRCNDLDLHGRWSQGGDLLLHPVSNAREHGATSREDSVGVQILTDVHVALHDGIVGSLMDTSRFHSQEAWLEEGFRASEALVTDSDHLTIRELVTLLKTGAAGSSRHLLLKVKSNIAELLLDVTDDFTLGSGGEGVPTLSEDLHQVVGQVTASQVQTEDGMGKCISFIDGHSVRYTITRIKHDTSGTSRGIQRKHSLDSHVHSWSVEGLKHDLGHLLTIGLRVEGSFSEKHRVFLWGNTKLIVEGVMPDLKMKKE